jgi:hypothetical protein
MIQVKSEHQVLREGFQILMANMDPSDAARFWAACHIGTGDYLKIKDQIFLGESVEILYTKILEYQSSEHSA